MIEHVVNWITNLIAHTGYIGVLILMALESACIPVPSEAIMPFAGSLIVLKPSLQFSLPVLALIGAVGNLLGSILAYWIGALGGRPFVIKYGKYLLIRRRDIEKSDAFFAKYGEATALFSRVLPIVRTFISLPAGIARMNFYRFCVFTFVGALPFCYLLAWAGVVLGRHWSNVKIVLHRADTAVSVVLIALLVLWFWHHLRPDEDLHAE